MSKDKTGKPGKKEGRLEKVIVTLLVILVSLLSFSVGVISGKNLSDQDYALKAEQKYSNALAEGGADQENGQEMTDEEVNHIASAAIEGAEKNSGPEEVAKTEESKTVEHKAEAHQAVDAKSQQAVAAANHGNNPVVNGKAQEKVQEKESAAPVTNIMAKNEAADEERNPSSVHKNTAPPQYTVQVAAYQSLKDAQAMSADLIKKGLPAFPFKVELKGQTWYRVSVGSFKTRKEAQEYQSSITKNGAVKTSVVQKIVR